jgi:hypothetical protein
MSSPKLIIDDIKKIHDIKMEDIELDDIEEEKKNNKDLENQKKKELTKKDYSEKNLLTKTNLLLGGFSIDLVSKNILNIIDNWNHPDGTCNHLYTRLVIVSFFFLVLSIIGAIFGGIDSFTKEEEKEKNKQKFKNYNRITYICVTLISLCSMLNTDTQVRLTRC